MPLGNFSFSVFASPCFGPAKDHQKKPVATSFFITLWIQAEAKKH
jgi:hypothetical protein